MIFRCLIVPLVAVACLPGQAFAKDMLPAAAGQTERDACMKEFVPLRTEAEERGKLIKAASARRASASETCELIGNFGQSEIKMIKYIDANSAKCEIAPRIADQLRAGHEKTEAAQKKVCAMAHLSPHTGPVGDFDDIGAPPLVR
ncbi:MAG: hypothetical protein E7813_16330 [Bradyrhizobium sp.]|uniref:hypothetical protein n=1 Tax=Bradyrhizobium sp. TaxID=376 RepID=UPI0012103E7A|nr:hypothetical protein [Bradyrhizobium sp.]THD64863.1 MAG: hypothetical protein E7813_16330 [Bradyrhizobium sp.]